MQNFSVEDKRELLTHSFINQAILNEFQIEAEQLTIIKKHQSERNVSEITNNDEQTSTTPLSIKHHQYN